MTIPPLVLIATFPSSSPSLERNLVRVMSYEGFVELKNRAVGLDDFFGKGFGDPFVFKTFRLFAVLDPTGRPRAAMGFQVVITKGTDSFWLTDMMMTRIHASKIPVEGAIFRWLLLECLGLDEVHEDGASAFNPHILLSLAIPRPLDEDSRTLLLQHPAQVALDRIAHSMAGDEIVTSSPSDVQKLRRRDERIREPLGQLLTFLSIRVFSHDVLHTEPTYLAGNGYTNSLYVLGGEKLDYHFFPDASVPQARWSITFDDGVTELGAGATLLDAALDAQIFTLDWDVWYQASVAEGVPVVPESSLGLFEALGVMPLFLQEASNLVTFLETAGAFHVL